MKPIHLHVVLLGALLLGGCGWLPKRYPIPNVTLPQHWDSGAAAPSASAASTPALPERWWEIFGDPQLNQLIERVLANNADLALAAIKVRSAQLQAGLSQTKLTPDVTLSGGATTSKDLKKTQLPSQRSYSSTFALNYEVDLWSKLAASRDSATWQLNASKFDLKAAALAMIGTAANLYWEIGALNGRILDAQLDIYDARNNLKLAQARHDSGAGSGAELAQLQSRLAALQIAHQMLLTQRQAQRKALVLLTNTEIASTDISRYQLPTAALPAIEPGLPASVLAQRPDVASAAARVRNSLANYEATRASFYPSISLTGSLGSSSRDVVKMLRNPIGSLGLNLALPFLQYNVMRLNIETSRTEYEATLVKFRQTLWQAFAEVDEALSLRQQLIQQLQIAKTALQAASAAQSISAARYLAGKTNRQANMQDLQAFRKAKADLRAIRLQQLQAQLRIYQALGAKTSTDAD